jgi:hypothetical protein
MSGAGVRTAESRAGFRQHVGSSSQSAGKIEMLRVMAPWRMTLAEQLPATAPLHGAIARFPVPRCGVDAYRRDLHATPSDASALTPAPDVVVLRQMLSHACLPRHPMPTTTRRNHQLR